MRVALYYAPALVDPLWTLGCRWLGRDPETNARVQQPDVAGIGEVTAAARQYGFHATLKPPMRLAHGATYADVIAATHALAGGIAPFPLPDLHVADLGGFLALRERAESMRLQALCDACVVELDRLRAPAPEQELVKRRRHGLSTAQEAMLTRWGYPQVFSTWVFHMTLTRRLDAAERPGWLRAVTAHFGDTLASERRVTDIAVFTQADPDGVFLLAERVALRG